MLASNENTAGHPPFADPSSASEPGIPADDALLAASTAPLPAPKAARPKARTTPPRRTRGR
jgi:hypothetical protein